MTILAVSNSRHILAALGRILERLFPDAQVIDMTDPLMAGKYAFHNKVELLLADAEMKRMDGVQLIRFVRQEQPSVRAYLLGRDCGSGASLPEGAEGYIAYPFSACKIAAALNAEGCAEDNSKTKPDTKPLRRGK